jgi:hypothetical protein
VSPGSCHSNRLESLLETPLTDEGVRKTTAGALDWDKTHICFTKRSLLEFLKWVLSWP